MALGERIVAQIPSGTSVFMGANREKGACPYRKPNPGDDSLRIGWLSLRSMDEVRSYVRLDLPLRKRQGRP